MDIKKLLEKNPNMHVFCNICNEEITKKDIEINNIIATITGKKNKNFVHKTCIIRR